MGEQMYEVIGEKYTGRHRVYKKGAVIPKSEIFGDEKLALEGQKGAKRGDKPLPDKKPVLKAVKGK